MQRIKTTLVGLIVAAVAAVVFAPSARAQMATLDAATLGAAVVVPWEVGFGGDQVTVATVTNALTSEAITLHVVVFNTFWQTRNFTCPLTPLETTYFVFDRDPVTGQPKVTYEYSDLGTTGPSPS